MTGDATFPEQHECSNEQRAQFFEWLNHGEARGYVSTVYCSTHDDEPMPEWERREWGEGGDPCCFVVRMFGPYYPHEPRGDDAAHPVES